MKYTILGKTGLRVSRLGFGCMRFPMTPAGAVDRTLAIPMLHRAVELGINYFDTAVGYCNSDSQRALGEAMEGRRDQVVLSTKNPMHEAPADSWWARLEESLKFLRTDYIDIYNMHGLTWNTWVKHIDTPTGKLKLLQRAHAEGLIRHICCSFHDTPAALVKLAETGVIESITVQYNLLDRAIEAELHRLKELNVGVVVMGPVGGGRLGVDSERIRALTGHKVGSVPEAALRFVLAHPAVSVALSGMSTLAMLEENVECVASREPFTPAEIGALDAEMNDVRTKRGVTCTACGYCLPCASGVDIPGNFGVYNNYTIYGLKENSQRAYAGLSGSAVHCIECGACLPKCPQKIDIPNMLRKVVAELDTKFDGWGTLFTVTGLHENRIQARVTVRNLTDRALPAVASFDFADAVTCQPAQMNFTKLIAGATESHPVQITAPDGVGIIEGQVRTVAGNELRASAIRVPFFAIPRDQTRWHQAKLTAEDFRGRQDVLADHGFRVGLRHDDDRVFVELEIRSKLHGLGKPGESSGARVELYVDMRPTDQGFGRLPYSDGAEHFFVSLGQPGGNGARSGKTYHLNQRNERTKDGVRVLLELPFAEFLKPGWSVPKRMGLDFMFVVCDAEGRDLGYPTYGGRNALYQDPSRFTGAILL